MSFHVETYNPLRFLVFVSRRWETADFAECRMLANGFEMDGAMIAAACRHGQFHANARHLNRQTLGQKRRFAQPHRAVPGMQNLSVFNGIRLL